MKQMRKLTAGREFNLLTKLVRDNNPSDICLEVSTVDFVHIVHQSQKH